MFNLLVPDALAAAEVTYTNLEKLNLADVIYLFAALAILGAGALSIVFVFFGGFSFILSGGDEQKVKQAIHTIRYAIIGLLVSLMSLVLVPLIGSLFGLNFNFLDFEALSHRINVLFSQFKTQEDSMAPAPATTPNTNLDDLVN